jgi:hypothetical protein
MSKGFAVSRYLTARAAIVAAAFVCTLAIAGAGSARASFPVKANVVSQFPKNFALAYTDKMPVQVTTAGPKIRGWKIELYTFGGTKIGGTKRFHSLRGTTTKKLHLKFPMQPGKYTLVVKGTARGVYGEYDKIARLVSCLQTLPIDFPKPGDEYGFAHDYPFPGFLTVKAAATGGFFMHDLDFTLTSFGGEDFGKATVDRLFSNTGLPVDIKLSQPLVPDDYTVFVQGSVDQPKACGPKTAKTTIHLD